MAPSHSKTVRSGGRLKERLWTKLCEGVSGAPVAEPGSHEDVHVRREHLARMIADDEKRGIGNVLEPNDLGAKMAG
jgi:hypothetical protein